MCCEGGFMCCEGDYNMCCERICVLRWILCVILGKGQFYVLGGVILYVHRRFIL